MLILLAMLISATIYLITFVDHIEYMCNMSPWYSTVVWLISNITCYTCIPPPTPPHTMTMILSQWPFLGNGKIGKSSAYNPPHTVYLNRIIADKMILLDDDDDDNDDGMVEVRTTTDKKIHIK